MAKKGQTFQEYTLEVKREAIRLYDEESLSYQAWRNEWEFVQTPKSSNG
jgi:hypothetical protein